MVKRLAMPSRPRHVNVFDEDWEFLDSQYGPRSANPQVGVSNAIRAIVHRKVLELKARANDALDAAARQTAQTGEGES